MTFDLRYQLMASGQVPAPVMADWLRDPLFALYVRKRQDH